MSQHSSGSPSNSSPGTPPAPLTVSSGGVPRGRQIAPGNAAPPQRSPNPLMGTPWPVLIAEAADPTTSPERLALLAQYAPHPRVVRSLAVNPNTPPDALLKLAEACPDHFLKNPVLPLLPLEHPGFYQQLTKRGALLLAARRNAPPALLARLKASADPAENAAARDHISQAGEADPESDEWRDSLRADRDALPIAEIPSAMAQHIASNPAQRAQIVRSMAGNDGPHGIGTLFEMMALGIAPAWVEKRLRDEEPDLIPLLDTLAERPKPDPLALAAADPNAAPETLWNCFAEVEAVFEGEIQAYMAEKGIPYRAGSRHHHYHLPPHLVPPPQQVRRGFVYGDRKQAVMGALLENPTTPPALLRAIVVRFPLDHFVEMAARHPALPPNAVEWLPLRSAEIRRILRERSWAKKQVVREALKRAALQSVVHYAMVEDRLAGFLALRYGAFPLSTLNRFVHNGLRLTRAAILLNAQAPIVLRRRLIEREGDRYVRAAGLARLAHPSRDFGI